AALLGQVHVRPAGEPVLPVPVTLPVSQQHDLVHPSRLPCVAAPSQRAGGCPLFERRLRRRHPVLGEAPEGAVEAPSGASTTLCIAVGPYAPARGSTASSGSRFLGSGLSLPTPWARISSTTASLTGVLIPRFRPWSQTC